jgi:hypothetical protein
MAPGPGTPTSDPCYGDEQITYSPETPRVGNELLIAVSSAHPHPYGRLAGTERTQFVRDRMGQLGYVWEWTVNPTYPGDQEYTFYVDSTISCKKISLKVSNALATATPKPTKTPKPWNYNQGNNNGNNNNAFIVVTATPTYYGYYYPPQYTYPTPDPQTSQNPQVPTNPQQPTIIYLPTPTVGPFNASAYLGQGDKYGCSNFMSQADAQAVLRADPTDPNKLDTNPKDGLACGGVEAATDGVAGGVMPPPYDTTPVQRP